MGAALLLVVGLDATVGGGEDLAAGPEDLAALEVLPHAVRDGDLSGRGIAQEAALVPVGGVVAPDAAEDGLGSGRRRPVDVPVLEVLESAATYGEPAGVAGGEAQETPGPPGGRVPGTDGVVEHDLRAGASGPEDMAFLEALGATDPVTALVAEGVAEHGAVGVPFEVRLAIDGVARDPEQGWGLRRDGRLRGGCKSPRPRPQNKGCYSNGAEPHHPGHQDPITRESVTETLMRQYGTITPPACFVPCFGDYTGVSRSCDHQSGREFFDSGFPSEPGDRVGLPLSGEEFLDRSCTSARIQPLAEEPRAACPGRRHCDRTGV